MVPVASACMHIQICQIPVPLCSKLRCHPDVCLYGPTLHQRKTVHFKPLLV